MSMRLLITTCAIFLVGSPLSARETISISADKPYQHKPSGLIVPPTLADLPRIEATILTADLDEFVQFETADGREALTVYVFRKTNGSVPVWADRAAWQIENRAIYGGAKPVKAVAAFTPPGQTNPSGLIATYVTGIGPFRSTAFALLPVGDEWYVKFRYSSATIEPAALDTQMRQAIAAIKWPKSRDPQPDAAPIGDCPAPLTLAGPASTSKSSVEATLLMAAALSAAADGDKSARGSRQASRTPAMQWCRDPGRYDALKSAKVYRPIGTSDQYLLAFGDAGVAAWVAPEGDLPKLLGKGEVPGWAVKLNLLGATNIYARRDRLPPPDQVAKIIEQEAPSAIVTTWGRKREIRIDSGTSTPK